MLIDNPAAIRDAIKKLRQLVRLDVKDGWNYHEGDLSGDLTSVNSTKNWQLASVNDKGYLVWQKGRQVVWLAQKFVIPHDLQGYHLSGLSLRLVLTWWAEDARVFVNNKLVQQGDLFDSSARVLLTNSAVTGEEFLLAIRLVSPGHDIGALMRSQLVYENNKTNIDPGFVADEIAILAKYLQQFSPEKLERLASEIKKFDWGTIADKKECERALHDLRQQLLPLAENLKQRCFHPLGHAHLDMAWLWTTAETYEVGQRTFQSVLSLQQNFPDLTFGHTTPVLYEWIEHHRPDLFAAIQKAVKQGKWELLGGMWVEPDVNLVGGEAIARQLLYGQRYFQEKFGEIAKVAWLPDSFGFCQQLPQFFKQSGIDYFVTGKLHWNDTTEFPHGCFNWESPDGTSIFTVMSPPNITGVMDTNPITMTDYAVAWESQTGLQDIFWLPGVGDHGGGPTKDMLEVASKWNSSPFFPRIKFDKAIAFLDKISADLSLMPSRLPVWRDELYLELHRGCYTVRGEQKKYNRHCEGLLYRAELFATLASLINQSSLDWQLPIEKAWKKVLFNQFHDILPGTSIPEVFVEANKEWEAAIEIGEGILQESLKAIASQIILPTPPQPDAKPLVVFNSLNWKRSPVISIRVTGHWEIKDLDGNKVRSQLTKDNKLLFYAEDIPSVGYRLFWLCSQQESFVRKSQKNLNREYLLENEYLKVTINPKTGDIDSIFDKNNCREILSGAGNQLQAFQDKGQYWDAWNIDPNYEQYPLPPTELKSIQWLDKGELQQSIRVVRQLGNSEFQQDYILQTNSSFLKIDNIVNWQETHVFVKAAFPFAFTGDYVTCETPCSVIKHPTNPQTPAERAKWEISALRWADLSDNNQEYGVSLLNDCKYGYDRQPNLLRLSLLRSPTWPDPTADRGVHRFTYAIYPHNGSWQSAHTVRRGYELNIPLQVVFIDAIATHTPYLPPVGTLLNLSADNLILMAVKPGEENSLVLRCYECHGEPAELTLQSDLNLQIGDRLNLLEQPLPESSLTIQPWQIASWQIQITSVT